MPTKKEKEERKEDSEYKLLFNLCDSEFAKSKVDDVAEKWKFRSNKRVTPKELEKAFPKLVSLVREGKISYIAAAATLAAMMFENPKVSINEVAIHALAEHALPLVANAQAEERRQKMREKLKMAMSYHVTTSYSRKRNRQDDSRLMQAAFRKAVAKHKATIVRDFYSGNFQLFDQTCYLLKVSPSEFKKKSTGYRDFYSDLCSALEDISLGFDAYRLTCWECGAIVRGGECRIKTCSGCNAARYCGKACQLKAWKDGHCEACQTLKPLYDRFIQNWRTVQTALANPKDHEKRYGMEPSGFFDYDIVSMLCSAPRGTTNGEAYMHNFYKNLKRVKAGELWIHPDLVTNEPIEVSTLTFEVQIKRDPKENGPFYRICKSLAYDYYCAEDLVGPSNALQSMWTRNDDGDYFSGKADDGSIMSPEEFLFRYHASSREKPAAKTMAKALAFNTLQIYHTDVANPTGDCSDFFAQLIAD